MTRQNTQPNSGSHAPALRCVLNVRATSRLLVAALLVATAGHIQAAILNVANNGLDSTACGAAQSPCRSISQAITNAAAGDEILVGPGRYGDLNGNGAMAEPGEETGVSGCSCMIAVNKAVIIRSTHGALATLLDSRTLFVNQNVLITADGAEFGRPGQGFTITPTMASALPFPVGIEIDSNNSATRGNQVMGSFQDKGVGINTTCTNGPVRIEDNQVMGWDIGIQPECADKTVTRNTLILNSWGVLAFTTVPITGNMAILNTTSGVHVTGGSASGNLAVGNGAGLTASFVGLLSGNSALGNSVGIDAFSDSGPVQGNNIFGNQCGMKREGPSPLIATNNYWGAATGPGTDPADNTCLGMITTSPFATAPFSVINPLSVPSAYRINAGGPAYVAVKGGQWIADSYFNTGSVITTTAAIANTTDDPLYQSQRLGSSAAPELNYSIAVQNGAYQVKLLFAEIVAQAAGQRVFNVKIQNSTVLSNFDIFASAGAPNKALTKTFNTTVTNGELTIEFDHVVDVPAIAAIEVLPQ